MLADEFGTASNIKSRVNRQSVLGAITSARQRLKLYNKVPPNGLVLYTGTIMTQDGKEKKNPLTNVKFMHEIDIIVKYFEEISQDTGKYVVGVDDTMQVLDTGAIETIIVWENLDVTRYVLKNSSTGETIIKHLNKEQDADESNFREPTTNGELEIMDKMPLLEWLANEYRKFGCSLEFVTNKSQEGSQFCRGFGGIGAILRYKLDVRAFDDVSDDGEVYEEVYVNSE
ncbi:PREDICTED: eukaryotic peptide chain release factor subunit 1-3-like [Nicotiana attenuata]|uniref:eukaryotic peptide chain release factor subunit 1-3-like n=1 Tax=Nicotiana attenuata TaxID=49451 RepID=UPI000904D510|nr:PREDICTED: eukaryotic peptide chain release factor subunit 1-3-like [Nicotiana attenuata]